MSVLGRFLLVFAVAVLAGCATLPPPAADQDILSQIAAADPAHALGLMREQEERLAHKPFVAGNSVQLLVNGPETFKTMLNLIDDAKTRVDMESYEFDAVEGRRFANLLLAKAAQGLDVNLVYDGFGALNTPSSLFDGLRKGGVHVLEFNPLHANDRVGIVLNRRDHRKLLAVDDASVITGGINITTANVNHPGDGVRDKAWRDTDVLITGPVAPQFEHYYLQTWKDQHAKPPPPPPPTPAVQPGDALVQAIDGAPSQGRPLIYRTLLAMIALSRHSVHLTTGFFVPPPEMRYVLKQAARRGVDVRIVVPAHSDSNMSIAAGRSYYAGLLKAGVKIYERLGRVLHAKTAVIDGAWSAVGSSNLDWRSVVWNNEIDAVIINREFGGEMEALFSEDLANSRYIDPVAWSHRGLLERFAEWRARLFKTLL